MTKEILAFIAIVQNNQIAFNAITGRLLHHLVGLIGGPEKLGPEDDDVANAIRSSMEFLGKKGATGHMSQDQCELLLRLIPKSKLPTAEPLPTAAEAARRKAEAEKLAKADEKTGSV